MPDIIIADTTCFILLTKINQLHLLKDLYGNIYTTPEIAGEFNEVLPDWVIVKSTHDHGKSVLNLLVDKGEASAIALALDLVDSTIILDDHKARTLATKLGIRITGTLGIIVKAKLSGIIPSIKPALEKISQTNFRLTSAIIQSALEKAEEL